MERKINLMDLDFAELQEFITGLGFEKYRAKQVMQWINSGVESFDGMSNIPKVLREMLGEKAVTGTLGIVHRLESKIDGTVKYVFQLCDDNVIESVLMKYKHGLTACVSSQAGCRMGCSFCASTGAGFSRNLTAGEILGQVVTMQKDCGERIGNIVIMGIGEPFDNYDNVLKFLRLVNSPEGLNVGYRHITISTCGLVPGILKLAEENIPVNLSVSLHAPDDELRSRLMPINRMYSIDKIIEACKIYVKATNRRITFEYAVIAGLNDSEEHAYKLAELIKGLLCHVNLIPVNRVEGTGYNRSSRQNIERFRNNLEKFGINATVRREMGADINAACGQLRKGFMEAREKERPVGSD